MDDRTLKLKLLAPAKATPNPVLDLRALKLRGLVANDNGRPPSEPPPSVPSARKAVGQ
jgi:hypothetical protein